MKIKTKTGQILDVERNSVTQILLDAGLATSVDTTPKIVPGTTTWTFGLPGEQNGVSMSAKVAEFRLHAHCSNPRCIAKFTLFYGPKAAETAKFCHCGRQDKCPPEISKAYRKAYEHWEENGR